MSESGNTPEKNNSLDKKEGSGSLVWFALALVIGFIVFAGLYSSVISKNKPAGGQEIASHAQNEIVTAAGEEETAEAPEEMATQETGALAEEKQEEALVEGEITETYDTPEDANAAVDARLLKLTTPRILGDPNAPMKITEYSSFTCGHCATFHKDTYKKIKAEYIDTGKAYLVFSDFPLNAPAMHASMAARCIPDESRYFDFVQLLYETQGDWAYKASYLTSLKQNAMLAGLSEDGFKECLRNLDLQISIANGRKTAQDEYKINSTPTIVINDRVVVGGALPFEEFKKKLDDELANSQPAE